MVLRHAGAYLTMGSLATISLQNRRALPLHLTKMTSAASRAVALSARSDSEFASSIEAESTSAQDSERATELHSESIERNAKAERNGESATVEYDAGTSLETEADERRAEAAADASLSDAAYDRAGSLRVRAREMETAAETDGAHAAQEGEAAASLEERAAAEESEAEVATEKAAALEAEAEWDAARAAEEGEAAAETEAVALEDVEAMASCAPIPFLDVVCDAVGGVAEMGYQATAAFESARGGMSAMTAVGARKKERAELTMAVEKGVEAAADAEAAAGRAPSTASELPSFPASLREFSILSLV